MTHPAEGDQYPHPDSPAGRAEQAAYDKTLSEARRLVDSHPETILAEANRIVNGQRRADYGGPFESFSDIAAGWSMVLGVEVTPEQVGLCMIQLKVARAKNGGFHRDSFVDIAGYAQCMEFVADAREAQRWGEGRDPLLSRYRHTDGQACEPRGIDEVECWVIVEAPPKDGHGHRVGSTCGRRHPNIEEKKR